MALTTYTATLNNQPATILGLRDGNGNLAAVHGLVSSSGVETGTVTNPLMVSITGTASTQAVTLASLPPLAAGTATIGNVGQVGGPWSVSWSGQSVSLTGPLPAGTNQLGSVSISGTVPVTGSFFQALQPISATILPLPIGAATEAKQPRIGAVGSPSADVITIQGIAGGTPMPITGTISATTAAQYNSTPPTLAPGASGPLQSDANGKLLVSGSFSASTTGQYNSTPPTVASGASTPLQTDSIGRLLVGNFPASQAVTLSGQSVALAAGSTVTVSNLPTTQAVSVASLPLPAGAASAAAQPALNADGGALTHIQNFPATQAVTFSGQSVALAANTSVALVAGTTVAVSNLPTTQAVSVASLPLPAGAATAAAQPALHADGGGLSHVMNFPSSQAVTLAVLPSLAAGTAQIGAVTIVGGNAAAVKVDASATTQPVSLTAIPPLAASTATIGNVGVIGGNAVAVKTDASATTQPISATALPLPLGAALSAKQPQIGTAGTSAADVMTFQGILGGTPLPIGGTIAIGATVSNTPISISGADAAGNKQHIRTDTFGTPADAAWSSGSGSLVALGKAIVAAGQSTTAAVLASSIVPPTPIFTQTTSAVASLVLKPSPGSLYACFVTTSTTAGYLMLFDAMSAPANGTVSPKNIIYCPANGTTEVEMPFLTAEPFATGIVAVFSTTGPYTLTASPAAFIKGIAQ